MEQALAEGFAPQIISNEGFLPGLEEVGRRFERNIFFLPQVMQSADTMQAGFVRLKAEMHGEKFNSLGKILMATVEGDIHDIGKNIVCTLLENHGFEVFDIGKNVSAATIIAKAKEFAVDAVAFGLMTTTMSEMNNVLKKLKAAGVTTFSNGRWGGCDSGICRSYRLPTCMQRDAMEAVAKIKDFYLAIAAETNRLLLSYTEVQSK